MEYNMRGKHSPNQSCHTDTHFPSKSTITFKSWWFLLKYVVFSQRKIKSIDPFFLFNPAVEEWRGCALNYAYCTTKRFILQFPFSVWLCQCRSWPPDFTFITVWHCFFLPGNDHLCGRFLLKNINTTAFTKNGKQETKWCEEGKCTIISLLVHDNEQCRKATTSVHHSLHQIHTTHLCTSLCIYFWHMHMEDRCETAQGTLLLF